MPNYRRHLPHWQPDGAELFVTWRLYGSKPGEHSIGPHWMQDPRIADCVMETLIESEQAWKLCRLSAWVVMPNHVHALLRPVEKLSKVLLVIKSASARRANRLLERSGQRFWQDESFDRWIRDQHERNQIIRYIEWNPVKAALVAEPENWPWSSASRPRSNSPHPS